MKPFVAPFAPASGPESPFARCDALETLVHQVREYAQGVLAGQAVLLAGHRGSGKSTVTLRAIEEVQRQWQRERNLRQGGAADQLACAKPFPVYLHGPDLTPFRSPNDHAPAEDLLKEVIRALHRALAKEMADEFRRQVAGCDGAMAIELAHRVRLELDGFPSASRLRQLWDATGLLGRGLFPARPARADAALSSASPHHELPDCDLDQGMREIVALYSVSSARQAMGDGEEKPEIQGQSAAPAGKALADEIENSGILTKEKLHAFSPLVSLASGLAVALLGLNAESMDSSGATLAGLATTAISFLFLHLTSAPARSRSLLSQVEVASLNRALPALVARIRDCGLAPIFVIDELDKLRDMDRFFKWLIHHGKGTLTDRLFCCFLVDRQHYEKLTWHIRQQVHPLEETFFSRRLLIHYTPARLSRFVTESWQFAPSEFWSERDSVRFVVLMASCHPGALRQVRDTYSEPASVTPPDVSPKGRPFRLPDQDERSRTGAAIAVLMQTAVEAVFRRGGSREKLRLETDFAHTVLDILYYPARSWTGEEGDGNVLRLDSQSVAAYLQRRTGLDYRQPSLANEQERLMRRLEQVVAYLWSPELLLEEVGDTAAAPPSNAADEAQLANVGDNVRALFKASARIPLERVAHTSDFYRWRFDQFGLPLTPLAQLEVAERALADPESRSGMGTLATWVLALNDSLLEFSAPVGSARTASMASSDLTLVRLLELLVPPAKIPWSQLLPIARSVRARTQTENADILLPHAWQTFHDNARVIRAALLGAILSRGGTFASRLNRFVADVALTRDGGEQRAVDHLRNLKAAQDAQDERFETLYVLAQRQSPLTVWLWLQTLRDLAAHLL